MSELVTMTDTNMNVSAPGVPSMRTSRQGTQGVDMQMERKGAMRYFLPVVIVAIVAGVGTGYVLSSKLSLKAMKSADSGTQQTGSAVTASTIQIGQIYGSKDESTAKDSAEGVLVVGGANGEGSHHIVREGGESQNVYLTSSSVDLKMFEGAKVVVRGETFTAQKAGWLMDVGQIKVEELNAPLPAWAQKAAEKAGSAGGDN